jgi:hypothetical protein
MAHNERITFLNEVKNLRHFVPSIPLFIIAVQKKYVPYQTPLSRLGILNKLIGRFYILPVSFLFIVFFVQNVKNKKLIFKSVCLFILRPIDTSSQYYIFNYLKYYICDTGRDSVVGIGTRCGLDGPVIEPRYWRDLFAPVQIGPEAHPAYCTMGTGSLSRVVKQSGRDVDCPPLSGASVNERIELYIYSPSEPSRPEME